MAKRTRPDANQTDIAEAINRSPGCRFIDTHNVPANLPELAGFPDGLVAVEGALTVICEDARQARQARALLAATWSGTVVLEGGLVAVEIKTAKGKLRASQVRWEQLSGVPLLVLRTIEQVFRIFRRV